MLLRYPHDSRHCLYPHDWKKMNRDFLTMGVQSEYTDGTLPGRGGESITEKGVSMQRRLSNCYSLRSWGKAHAPEHNIRMHMLNP